MSDHALHFIHLIVANFIPKRVVRVDGKHVIVAVHHKLHAGFFIEQLHHYEGARIRVVGAEYHIVLLEVFKGRLEFLLGKLIFGVVFLEVRDKRGGVLDHPIGHVFSELAQRPVDPPVIDLALFFRVWQYRGMHGQNFHLLVLIPLSVIVVIDGFHVFFMGPDLVLDFPLPIEVAVQGSLDQTLAQVHEFAITHLRHNLLDGTVGTHSPIRMLGRVVSIGLEPH